MKKPELMINGHKTLMRHGKATVAYSIFLIAMVLIPVFFLILPWITYSSSNVTDAISFKGLDIVKFSYYAIQFLVTKNQDLLLQSSFGAAVIQDFCEVSTTGFTHYMLIIVVALSGVLFTLASLFAVTCFVQGMICIFRGKLSAFKLPTVFATVAMILVIFASFGPVLVLALFALFAKSESFTYQLKDWLIVLVTIGVAIILKIIVGSIYVNHIEDRAIINSKKELEELQNPQDNNPQTMMPNNGFPNGQMQNGGYPPFPYPPMGYPQFYNPYPMGVSPMMAAPVASAPQPQPQAQPAENKVETKNEKPQVQPTPVPPPAAPIPNPYEFQKEYENKALLRELQNKVIQKRNGLPNNLTSISDSLFMNNIGLFHALIPEGITSLGNNAFANCSNLRIVSLPKTLTKIESNVFFNCQHLVKIYYCGNKEGWKKINRGSNWLLNTGTRTVICVDGSFLVDPSK